MMKKKSQSKQGPISIASTINMPSSKANHNIINQDTAIGSAKKSELATYCKTGKTSARLNNYKLYTQTKYQQQEFSNNQPKLTHKKQARSISSFSKRDTINQPSLIKNSPHKKGSISRYKIRNNENGPYQKIIQLFALVSTHKDEKELVMDTFNKFQKAKFCLLQELQSGQVMRCIDQIKIYILSIFDQLMEISYKNQLSYERQIEAVINQYEQKLKQQQLQIKQNLQKSILQGQTQFSKNFLSIKMRSLFSTKVFNQMQKSGIDLQNWISNTKLMDTYISIMHNHLMTSDYDTVNHPQTMRVKNLVNDSQEDQRQIHEFFQKYGKTEQVRSRYISSQIQNEFANQFDAHKNSQKVVYKTNQELNLNKTNA